MIDIWSIGQGDAFDLHRRIALVTSWYAGGSVLQIDFGSDRADTQLGTLRNFEFSTCDTILLKCL